MDADNPYAPPLPVEFEPTSIESLTLADPGTRFGARMVDQMLAMGSVLPGLLLYFAMGADDSVWMAACALPGFLALTAYQWYLTATEGATLGKRWSNIRIVREDGLPIDFVRGVVLRVWVLNVFVVVLGTLVPLTNLVGMLDALMVFTHNHRTLHDRIAGTRVVRLREWWDDDS